MRKRIKPNVRFINGNVISAKPLRECNNCILVIQRSKVRNKAGVWLFIIGTDVGKDT
ncbi:hypothetical protein [uncultured Clostridium sp.]|uniref:hypothetical protein n=1 Tax=uncultured Clostridium sp. TaxID=59620 RepID=UPI0028E26C52|nr:hypothetical protein [uncultured Clostridium sp.]